MKPMSSYQAMQSVLKPNIQPTNTEIQSISGFFFIRWLSSDIRCLGISNFYNRYYKEIPIHIQYKMAKQILAGRIKWIQFPKKEKNEDIIITNISRYYKISLEHAVEYLDLMPKDKIQEFKTLYPKE